MTGTSDLRRTYISSPVLSTSCEHTKTAEVVISSQSVIPSQLPAVSYPLMSSRYSFYNLDDDVLRMIHERAVLTAGIVAGIATILIVNYFKSPWRRLPPGPPGLPIIGNALQLVGEPWIKFSAWRKEYGMLHYLVRTPSSADDHPCVYRRHHLLECCWPAHDRCE